MRDGLGDVIIAACIQPAHHVEFLILGGEEQNGQRYTLGAPFPAQGYAVAIRQRNIQHDEIDLRRQGSPGLGGGGGCRYGIPFAGEQLGQPFPQGGVVFEKEDMGHGAPP